MDPRETLKKLKQAVRDGEVSEGFAALLDYYQWRVKGGRQVTCLDYNEQLCTGDMLAERSGALLLDKIDEMTWKNGE